MNEHSKNFEKVKKYYESGLWTKEMVYNAAFNPKNAPWITIEEAKEILDIEAFEQLEGLNKEA